MSKVREIKEIEESSRDYDLSIIETDPRFKQTTKEFWITLGVYLVFAACMIANLLLLNGSKIQVLGFPLWIFVEILIIVGFVTAVILLSTYVYKDMDITPEGKIYEKQKKKERKSKWILIQSRE
ncbi:MAG: YhdT family protein [Lachnospiraceae bacterium]|nr:YhdT family protein [Lachnospiraceae bacterium]